MLRQSILCLYRDVLALAVWRLAHFCFLNMDTWWNESNTVHSGVKHQVQASFRWSTAETIAILGVVDEEDMFIRGSVGGHAYLILAECAELASDIDSQFETVLEEAIRRNDHALASKALVVIQFQAGEEAPARMRAVEKAHPMIGNIPKCADLISLVDEYGWQGIARLKATP
jgi:hypothetical protein